MHHLLTVQYCVCVWLMENHYWFCERLEKLLKHSSDLGLNSILLKSAHLCHTPLMNVLNQIKNLNTRLHRIHCREMTRLYYCCVIAIFTLIRAGRKNLFCLLTTVDVFQVLLAVERRIRRYRKAQDRSNSGVNTVKWLSWEMAWGKLPKMSRAKHRCEYVILVYP